MPVYKYQTTIRLGDGKRKKVDKYLFDYKKVVDGIQYHRKKRGFDSRDEAVEQEYLDKQNLGKDFTKQENILFKDLFDMFYVHKSTKQKLSTLEAYRYCYNSHLSCFSNKAVSTIYDQTITKWKKYLMSKNMCQGATNRAIRLFRSILEYGIRKGFKISTTAINELDVVNLQEIKKERIAWSKEEMQAFFNSFDLEDPKDNLYYHYFLILLHGTFRPNEYRCITKADIQGQYIRIDKSVTTKISGKGTILQPPKTPQSVRKVIMPQEDIDYLVDLTKDYDDNDFVFGRTAVLSETTLKRVLDKHIALSGIRHGSPYNFRHTSITNLILNGTPLLVVSKRAGHSNVSTTMNHYWHLFKNDEEKALNGMILIENTLKNTLK